MNLKLHEKIRVLRLLKGISVEEAADALDMDKSAYSRLERGLTRLDIEKADRIGRYLGCSLAELIQYSPRQLALPPVPQPLFLRSTFSHNEEYIRHLKNEIRFLREQLAASGEDTGYIPAVQEKTG